MLEHVPCCEESSATKTSPEDISAIAFDMKFQNFLALHAVEYCLIFVTTKLARISKSFCFAAASTPS